MFNTSDSIATVHDSGVETEIYLSGEYWLVDVTARHTRYTEWGPTQAGFQSREAAIDWTLRFNKVDNTLS